MNTYTDDDLLRLVPVVTSMSQLMAHLGYSPNSGHSSHNLRKAILRLEVSAYHWHNNEWFLQKDPGKKRRPVLIALKKEIILERGRICENCGLDSWITLPIALDLHHVDGDPTNNSKNNLQLLCPNCHSQTPNWRFSALKKTKYVSPKKCNTCPCCGVIIDKYSINCIACNALFKRKFEISKEELEKLIQELPMTKIGEMFGVSDNAVKKRAKKLGIELKPRRGYWTKKSK